MVDVLISGIGSKLPHGSLRSYILTLVKGLRNILRNDSALYLAFNNPTSYYIVRIERNNYYCETRTLKETIKFIKKHDIVLHIPSVFAGILYRGIELIPHSQKVVITIHGISPLYTQNFYSDLEFVEWYFAFTLSKKIFNLLTKVKNMYIVVPSKHALKQVENVLKNALKGSRNTRIRVIYHGINTDVFKPVNISCMEFKHKFGNVLEPREYLVHVGASHPKKNILTVLMAFKLFKSAISKTNIKLVIIDKPRCFYKRVYPYVQKLGLKNDVMLLHNLAATDLAVLYSNALALVFPSLDETFGYTVAESLACGTPVITSYYVASATELFSDLVYFVSNPLNYKELAYAMEKIIFDNNYYRRKINSVIDTIHTLLSPSRMAKQYLKLYERLERI